MPKTKTPLRYPGGKSRAMNYLLPRMRVDVTEFRDAVVGGGSVFVAAKEKYRNATFWINDAYYNLYNCWIVLRDDGETLSDMLLTLKNDHREDMSKADLKSEIEKKGLVGKEKSDFIRSKTTKAAELFLNCKHAISKSSYLDRAAYFYVLNKCSFSELTEQGTFSPQASIQIFSQAGVERLSEVSKMLAGVRITNDDYSTCFEGDHPGCFIFMDPPYDIGKQNTLYGKDGTMHSTFMHQRFADECRNIKSKFMITYNNSDIIRSRFQEYNCEPWSLKYGMRIVENEDGDLKAKNHKENELLITNYKF